MTAPSFEQLVRGLLATGTERANAERLARRKLGIPDVGVRQPPSKIVFPLHVVLPWSLLVSDNERHGVINGRLLLTVRYRQAKAAIAHRVGARYGDAAAVAFPLRLEALVWVPDDTHAHDVPNFAKCVHDALEGVVYVKDRWLWKVTWERAGVDVDQPRAEITITPLEGAV